MLGSERPAVETNVHRFAWDGFSFPLPAEWDLADYRLDPKGSSARFEDDTAVRLDLEWVRCPMAAGREAFLRRYALMAAELEKAAEARTEPIQGLPEDWTAKLHAMPDKRLLATAYGSPVSASGLQVFLRAHFDAASRREPSRLLRMVAEGFQVHDRGRIPWAVFDVSFELDASWRLVGTAFQAGRKRFTFVRRARRLELWFCSLADLALRGRSLGEWAADMLGTMKSFEARRFIPASNGRLQAVRRGWLYPFGHAEEIARWCFRYQARCLHDRERNRLVLAVLQYRVERDLDDVDLVVPGFDLHAQSFFG